MKLLLLLATGLVLSSCAQNDSDSKLDLDTRLVAFGDSHTAGVPLQRETYIHNLLTGLQARKTMMNNDFSTYTIALDNQAVAGSLFDNQYSRIMQYQFKKSDTVVMLLGYNDVAMYGTDVTRLNRFKTDLIAALTYIEQSGSSVYLGTCIYAPASTYAQQQGSRTACDLYSDATKEVGAKFANVKIVDTHTLMDGMVDADLIDTVHFNLSQHNKLAQIFLDAIK